MPIDSFARQITTSDFIQFTHILAADDNNLRQLNQIKPSNATAEVRLWGSYDDNKSIPDPYYGRMVCCDYDKMEILCSPKIVLSEWFRKGVRAMRPPLKRLLRQSYKQIRYPCNYVMYSSLKIE